METKTVAAAYLLKSREAMLHKIVSRSVAAGGSLLFSIVQIEYERYNAGNRAESAENANSKSKCYVHHPLLGIYPARTVNTSLYSALAG